MVVCSDRSVSAVVGDATGRLGTAGSEGTLASNEQDVQDVQHRAAPTLGYCTLSYVDG